MDQHLLSFLDRATHVASMAFMLGGTLLVWALSLKSNALAPGDQPRLLLLAAEKYETFFWIAIAIQVITGIGNLGAFGTGLPNSNTQWGVKLTLKLSMVLVLVALSLIRTLLVTRLETSGTALTRVRLAKVFQMIYGGTALYLLAILVLAVALAHG